MAKIIVLGSINMDVVVTAPKHPQLGETIFGDALHFIPGGKGSNQAVAAGRLGGDVVLIGRLGQDAFGDTLHEFLTQEGIDLSQLRRVADAPTGTALITVDHSSENTIVVISGANRRFDPTELDPVSIQRGDVIVSQFEVPQASIRALFSKARAAGATTVLNPAPASEFEADVLALTDVLIVNETELAYFAQASLSADLDVLAGYAKSLSSDSAQVIVVTIGAQGALFVQGDEVLHVEGIKVQAVDTTGAGDCFVGALSVALSEGLPYAQGLKFANRAASISVQRLGAAVSLPTRAEVDALG